MIDAVLSKKHYFYTSWLGINSWPTLSFSSHMGMHSHSNNCWLHREQDPHWDGGGGRGVMSVKSDYRNRDSSLCVHFNCHISVSNPPLVNLPESKLRFIFTLQKNENWYLSICYISTFQVLVPGSRKSVMLQPLLSDTEYKITVNPIYPEGEDPEGAFSLSSIGRTCESLLFSSSATLNDIITLRW